MTRHWIVIGALSAALSVALGAFGAHGLKGILPPEALAVYQTGVAYQFVHALGLMLTGVIAAGARPVPALQWAGWCMLAGTVLFSGSLYLLSVTGLRGIGLVTPFGGVALIVAWLLLAIGGLKVGR